MVIDTIFLKRGVAQIGPQHRHHAQFVSTLKGGGDLFNLAAGFRRTKVDSRADRYRTHIECLLDAGVVGLIIGGRVAEGFVMVEFHEKRNAVGITAGDRGQHAVS